MNLDTDNLSLSRSVEDSAKKEGASNSNLESSKNIEVCDNLSQSSSDVINTDSSFYLSSDLDKTDKFTIKDKNFILLKKKIKFLFGFFSVFFVLLVSMFVVFRAIWTPTLIGIFLASVIDPVVSKIEKITNFSRALTSFLVLTCVSVVVFILGLILSGPLVRQAQEIVMIFPQSYQNLSSRWKPLYNKFKNYIDSLDIPIEIDGSIFQSFLSPERISSALQNTFGAIWSTVPGVISFSFTIIIIPLALIFWLLHFAKIKNYTLSLVPSNYRDSIVQVFSRIYLSLKYFVIGQTYVALALGFCYVIGYSLIGIKGSIFIGIAAGIGRLIPTVDMVIAFVLSTAVILSSDGDILTQLLSSVMIIACVSVIDAVLLTPKLIGSSSGLSPIIVFSSIIAFSTLMGFWGVVIAIPVVVIFKELAVIIVDYYSEWKSFHYDENI